jgi:hypothetical protein
MLVHTVMFGFESTCFSIVCKLVRENRIPSSQKTAISHAMAASKISSRPLRNNLLRSNFRDPIDSSLDMRPHKHRNNARVHYS